MATRSKGELLAGGNSEADHRPGAPGRRPWRAQGGLTPRWFNRWLLVLFLAFTALLGVREARGDWNWMTAAGCAGACTQLFRNHNASYICAGCLAQAGRDIGEWLWQGGGRFAGYGCAKAEVGC